MSEGTFLSSPSLDDYIETDKTSRELAKAWIKNNKKH
jgi:hypothetical protein